MAWEELVRKQGQLATVLAGKAMTRWLNAKTLAKANSYDPKQFVNDMVSTWAELLDFWWGPWCYGSPLLPVLFVRSSAGKVGLDHDVTAASIAFTACAQVGGTNTIPALSGGKSNIKFTIVDGSNILVTGITAAPKAAGLYLGLAMEGVTPVATVVVQL